MIKAVLIEPNEQIGRWLLFGPKILVVPPGDHRRHMQIFGLHQQFDVLDRPMDVKFARPPALGCHVGQTLQLHGEALVRAVRDGERAGANPVLRPALDFVGVLAGSELQLDGARTNKMVAPEREFCWTHRLAGAVFQVDAAGNRLAGVVRMVTAISAAWFGVKRLKRESAE